MFVLNIAADDVLLIKSGMLLHNRLPQNLMESIPKVVLFAAGICSKSQILKSCLVFFLIKYSCTKGGLVLICSFAVALLDLC